MKKISKNLNIKNISFYLRNYKFNSILIRNFILILAFSIIPLILSNLFIFEYQQNIYKNEIANAYYSSLMSVRDNIDSINKEVTTVFEILKGDIRISEFITKSNTEMPLEENKEKLLIINEFIYKQKTANIDSIYIYSNNSRRLISSENGINNISTFFDNVWASNLNKDPNIKNWADIRRVRDSLGYTTYLSYFQIYPIYDNHIHGLSIINIDIVKLKHKIENITQNKFEDLYITNADGKILFSMRDNDLLHSMDEIPILKKFGKQTDIVTERVKIGNMEKIINAIPSEINHWEMFSVISLEEYNKNTTRQLNTMIYIIIVSVIMALIFSFFISYRIYEPIRNIVSIIEDPTGWSELINHGNYKSIGEIRYIISNILSSKTKTKILEKELANRLHLLQKSQAAALQEQIKPHFLYNTLQTISWLVMKITNGENAASKAINNLSSILRIGMETANQLVTIEEDIGFTKMYIDLMKLRYKNRFTIKWNINDEILDYAIPKISIQPLVENALYHGIKPSGSKGYITITGATIDNTIEIKVTDNGKGFDRKIIETLSNDLANSTTFSSHHIGLRNVNQRIKILLGDKYGITIDSNGKSQTAVIITIPRLFKGKQL